MKAQQIDYNALSEEALRELVLRFVDDNCPPDMRYGTWRGGWRAVSEWSRLIAERGWMAPAWPTEHGGMGLDAAHQIIFHEAMDLAGAPRLSGSGPQMLGPLVIRYGTPEQQQRLLPPIVRGEVVWCQGYSEPNAGSDLASLTTRAVRDGDDWIVDGRKIWTTWAHQSDWIFMLVRTSSGARKQDGISFLVADMKTPGITASPIASLTGDAEFCEVVLEDVRVPAENMIGAPGEGWTMAKALLGFERLYIGSPKQARDMMIRLRQVARRATVDEDPAFVRDLARLTLDILDLEATYERFRDVVKHGRPLGAEVSILKIWSMEMYQRVADMVLRVAAEEGSLLDPLRDVDGEIDILSTYLHSRTATIYAGSNDIQRNIVAKAVLGLPTA